MMDIASALCRCEFSLEIEGKDHPVSVGRTVLLCTGWSLPPFDSRGVVGSPRCRGSPLILKYKAWRAKLQFHTTGFLLVVYLPIAMLRFTVAFAVFLAAMTASALPAPNHISSLDAVEISVNAPASYSTVSAAKPEDALDYEIIRLARLLVEHTFAANSRPFAFTKRQSDSSPPGSSGGGSGSDSSPPGSGGWIPCPSWLWCPDPEPGHDSG
ncbi:hypothetical protein BV25DRAFT_1705729 [Artomyces pyxidatus]|uniref:Uncharacterized protein n=1 Tax=Artomyces pyxidatus TaxID=48021 RepID=A0ACB8TB66_9AGAM|nr:hypothetical protein BV25DRAFT_1705729 [Artomyces pyxidatus]